MNLMNMHQSVNPVQNLEILKKQFNQTVTRLTTAISSVIY